MGSQKPLEGRALLDEQHERLARLAGELRAAFESGAGFLTLDQRFTAFLECHHGHFITEERIFDEIKYPGAEEHKEEHRRFTERVLAFKRAFDRGEAKMSLEMVRYASDFLDRHIKTKDAEFFSFLEGASR